MASAAAAPAPALQDPKNLPKDFGPNFAYAGAMTPESLKAVLESKKFRGWLYVNTDSHENSPSTLALSAQLPYLSIPFSDSKMDAITAEHLVTGLDSLPKPVLVQCGGGNRARAVIAVYLAHKLKITPDTFPAFMQSLGFDNLSPWMQKFVLNNLGKEYPDAAVFLQLFDKAGESSTYTYLLADPVTKKALLIDPVKEQVDRDLELIASMGLELQYVLNTHVHADHITGSGLIKKRLNPVGGEPVVKSVISAASGAKADILVKDGDVITLDGGRVKLEVRSTPGHTTGCVSYVTEANGGCCFTGDTLLIGGCGRTDFQGGDAEQLFNSVHSRIFTLPDHYRIYPAHDYKGQTVTTVAEEKAKNPRLTKTMAEFVALMGALNLPYPKKIDASQPANQVCGVCD